MCKLICDIYKITSKNKMDFDRIEINLFFVFDYEYYKFYD